MDLDIGLRIKQLRKDKDLSQDELGKILGITNTAISGYESGRRNPTDQIIISMCRELNVNEDWLRYGEGEMYYEFPKEDEFIKAAAEISKNNDELVMQAVIEYWKLDNESKALLKRYLTNIANNIKNKE